MADDLSYWMAIAERVVVVVFLVVIVVTVCAFVIYVCTLPVQTWWQSPRMRLFRIGGVTTLRRTLSYPCILCQDSMEAGEKVRTLSCGHTFHCGGSVKCVNDIDQWLSSGPRTSCPFCRQAPNAVLPWKRPPPSSTALSPSASSSTLTSIQDLEEALLPRAHHETLPEASSSAPVPPLAQSPPTSTPDLEDELPPPADDEILPGASSSQ